MKALLSLLAFTALPLAAQSISSDDAREVARQFFAARPTQGGQHAPAKADPVLAYTATTAGTADFYVFNRAAESGQALGFVIVNAADGAETPILGYSETSTFDYEAAPSNLRWWLSQYQQNGVARVPAKAGATRHDVGPLVTTKWGQDAPYNTALPDMNGYKRLVTGCTATAMTQVMKYYKYPTTGKGQHSYQQTWEAPIGTKTFSADFEHTTYDWANMLDDYSHGSYTAAQADAVATLMYHAGVAEDSKYGQNETGADDRHSGMALIDHFRYSPAMLRGERAYFSDEEWDNTIYNELAANRPVLYAGSTKSNEGHAFVCDGYRASDGFFHMNWGWDGISDGYFALVGPNALNPATQGTGGAASGQGFTESQSINYNILPTEQGTATIQLANLASGRTFSPYKIEKGNGGSAYSASVDCAVSDETMRLSFVAYNCGLREATVLLGAKIHNTATGEETIMSGEKIALNASHYSSAHVTFNTKDIAADGTYEVIPVYRDYYDSSAPWQAMLTVANQQKVTLTVTGTASRPTYVPQALTVTEVVHQGDPYVFTCPDDFKITVKVENNTGASLSAGWVCPRITHDGGWYSKGSGWNGILPAGFTSELNFNLYNSDASFTPGHVYKVEFYKDTSNSPDNELLPGISSFTFIYASPEPTVGEMTGVIREARGGRATVPMIERMAEKVLKK